MAYGAQLLLQQLMAATNLADGDTLPIDQRLEAQRVAITGQDTPIGPAMQNRPVALRVFGLDDRLSLLEQFVVQHARAAPTAAQLAALTARLDLLAAAGAATQSQLEANGIADAALRLHEQAQDAQLVLLASRATTDEAAIAAALAKAEAAQGSATAGISAAAAAQLTANSNAAALTAVQADVASRLPAAAVRRFAVAVPALSIVLATPATVAVLLPEAYADDKYEVFFTKAAGGLLNTELGWLSKTKAGFTLTLRNTNLATLAVPAGSVEVFTIHF